MDFWRTVAVLFRRWYITLPAFVATLGLMATAYSVVPVQYQSDAVLVLTTPLSGGTTTSSRYPLLTNPLTNFDRSLALSASIVIQQLSSPETANQLRVTPGGATYTVSNGSTNPELLESGPFIFVQGSGTSREAAEAITERVTAEATHVLAERQDDLQAPASTHISVHVVVPPTEGRPLNRSALRAAAAAGVLAGLVSLAAVYGFESFMTYRRQRRMAHRPSAQPIVPVPARVPVAAEVGVVRVSRSRAEMEER